MSGVHVNDVQPFSSSDFNMTHKIRHLSFGRQLNSGDNAAQRHVNPLDGVEAPAEKGATMFQYYVKIVPTLYTKQAQGGSADETAAEVLSTYQFSVTRHEKVKNLSPNFILLKITKNQRVRYCFKECSLLVIT